VARFLPVSPGIGGLGSQRRRRAASARAPTTSIPPQRAQSIEVAPVQAFRLPCGGPTLLGRPSCELEHALPAPLVATEHSEATPGDPMSHGKTWLFIDYPGEVDALLHQRGTR
jgi:hypothetical protein